MNRNIISIERLKSIVGEAIFNELLDKIPGMNIYIPKNYDPKCYDKQFRDKSIKKDFYNGIEVPDLMIKYNLSKSRIHHIIGDKQDAL